MDKVRYKKEVAAFAADPRRAMKVKKKDLKFKRPNNSFITYYNRELPVLRGLYPDTPLPQLNKQLSATWRSLSPQDKAPYQKAYRTALATYRVNYQQHLKYQLESRLALPKKPPYKRKRSAFAFFTQEALLTLKHLPPRDRFRQVKALWAACKDRGKYEKLAAKDAKRFEADVIQYNST